VVEFGGCEAASLALRAGWKPALREVLDLVHRRVANQFANPPQATSLPR